VVVDATRSGEAPGTVRRLPRAAPALRAPASSHALGVSQALALAEALGRAPRRLELVGVEAGDGTGLTPCREVERAVPGAVALVREVLAELLTGNASD
jgi:hydrogenase maturation protease